MRKQINPKLLSIILVLIMALAVVPFWVMSALATDPEAPKSEVTEVSTWNELINAVNDDKAHIKLLNNITDEVPGDELPTRHRLVFDGGKEYTLDLNGYRLYVDNSENEFYTNKFSLIEVRNSSKLTIQNGSIGFFNGYADSRTANGVVLVTDDSVLNANKVSMSTYYQGTVVHATDNASVTLEGGDYTAMNGFALYMEKGANLTLNGGVNIGTKVGDSAATVFVDGYGALYSESTGELVINSAYFKTGIQVTKSQIDAFNVTNHELVINDEAQKEDVYLSNAGNQFSAIDAGKTYYWYSNGNIVALYRVDTTLFANTVRVISYDVKYPITVKNGTATVNGSHVTEASYGQEVTIVANAPESGMEFVSWGVSGAGLNDYYTATTTFTMAPNPVTVEANYGRESVKEVSVEITPPQIGQRPSNEATVLGDAVFDMIEWSAGYVIDAENSVFLPGTTYVATVRIEPAKDRKFGDTVSATVNGKAATVIGSSSGHVLLQYTFDALETNPFPILYNISTAQLGVGGRVELDTALMSEQSKEFKDAFDAEKVSYQWYKNGEAIEGATNVSYVFTKYDIGGRFIATATIDGKTAWATSIVCSGNLYRVDLNISEIKAGTRFPTLTSDTQGVVVLADEVTIFQVLGENTFSDPIDPAKGVLLPGKRYSMAARLRSIDASVSIGSNASFYINGQLAENGGNDRVIYEFTIDEADYPVYYQVNGEIGIGVTITVDTEKMCNESGTFKNAYDKANPTYQTVFYQWYKNGEKIDGATDSSYTVKTTDKNSYIHCQVTLVDGKMGLGDQFVIKDVITVITLQMAVPKNGETRIDEIISADGVNLVGIMWWPKETGATMSGDATYEEGTVYEYYIQLEAKDGFRLDFQDEMTCAYIYGVKAANAGSVPNTGRVFYTGEITAIHKHIYGELYGSDAEGHWQRCMVSGCPCPDEEYEGYVFHYGGEATCHTAGKCTVCQADYYAEHDFSSSEYVYKDEMTCVVYCGYEGCTAIGGTSFHTGGVSTCKQKAICDVCHSEYGKLAECAGGKATCTEKAICATCGEEYGDTLAHQYTIENGYKGADGHANACSCGAHDTPVAHNKDRAEATEKDPVKCTVCDYIIEPVKGHVHTPSAEWSTDKDNHWYECQGCEGQQLEKGEHVDANDDQKCDTCGYAMPKPGTTPDSTPSSKPGTTDSKPGTTDSKPGTTDSTPGSNSNSTEGEEGLGAGAIVGIVVGVVAVLGAGGFAIYWFVIRKKKK